VAWVLRRPRGPSRCLNPARRDRRSRRKRGRFRRGVTVTVSSEEAARGKPAPDVYLEAVRRLGVDPARAAAVEDSRNGIRSASAAGLRVVVIPNAHFPPDEESLELADVVLDSLAAVTPEAIAR
jgi:beta-phosphoglucomutase-like phosphatase (HAD superfamily)